MTGSMALKIKFTGREITPMILRQNSSGGKELTRYLRMPGFPANMPMEYTTPFSSSTISE
jgi:hypothetical protein